MNILATFTTGAGHVRVGLCEMVEDDWGMNREACSTCNLDQSLYGNAAAMTSTMYRRKDGSRSLDLVVISSMSGITVR